jgi:serine phosphatase RsbU (regulator of sigma subunit)
VFLLADASGHGAHAALTSMLLKAVFHECARIADCPEGLLEEMNARLFKFLPKEMFACAAAVWITPQGIRLSNGGLPYPYVLRAAGGLDELPVAGLPLGLFPDSEMRPYDSCDIELGTGDALLLASDGLGDVRDTDGEFFQDQRLRQAIEKRREDCAGALVEGLMSDAAQFRESDVWPDDVSLIAIRRV